MRARFYNPVIGRFTQEDTYRGDGLNLYAYCGNNPVIYYDPSGYAKKQPCPQGGNKERQTNKANEHHKMRGVHLRDNKVISDRKYKSGNDGRPGKLNQQESLLTHTERKFIRARERYLKKGDSLKMEGTLPPCKPG